MNEKIDVLKYDPDPVVFIKNALSPAQVDRVIIMDADKKQALAIVQDSQFSLAIGRQGQNVRLANRLCDWNIDVKTVEQAAEIDFSEISTVQSARSLFNDEEESFDEITTIAELPGVNKEIADLLIANGFEQIEDFVEAFDNDTIHIEGVTADDLETINGLINENVEFVEEDEDSTNQVENETNESQPEAEEDEYFCPECGAKITLDMTQCPVCGVEFEFEEDEE